MFDTSHLEVDTSEEVLAHTVKKKTTGKKKKVNRAITIKRPSTRRRTNSRGRKKRNKGKGKSNKKRKRSFSPQLRKSLAELDSHHLDKAYNYIEQEELQHKKVSFSILSVWDYCKNCSNCIRAINQCFYYHINCDDFKPKSCKAKIPLK